jgi:regulatory protein
MRRGRPFGGRRATKPIGAEKAADPGAVRLAALALLGRRDFPSGELRDKLLELGYEADPIADALLELTQERLVDDARYAANFTAYHAQRGHGPMRIRQLLKSAGVASELIAAALDAGPDWQQVARELRNRRFGNEIPGNWSDRARQMRFLQYRGFSNDHIRSALGTSADPDLDDAPGSDSET